MAGSSGSGVGSSNDHIPEYEKEELYSRVFHVGSFGALWREQLGKEDLSLQQAAPIDDDVMVAEDFNCTPEIAAELRAVCSIDALKSSDKEDTEVIPEDTRLVTLGIRRKALERREERIIIDRACRQETFIYEMRNSFAEINGPIQMNLRRWCNCWCNCVECRKDAVKHVCCIHLLSWCHKCALRHLCDTLRSYTSGESHSIGKRPKDPVNLVEEGELLLTINIFYPVIFQKHKIRKPYQTMLVLGSQKLTEVRDTISCVSDLQIGGEFSNHPDQAPEHISKDLYKSAFFYFEGIFYNDRRHSECRDLSRTVIEWAESRDRGYANLQAVKMEDYTFNDLNIKIGFPYLYCHQGDCEHLVIITDIRLIHQDDCLDRSLYPLLTKKHWLWTKKCFVCKMYTARWVTNNDSLAPQDPSFFCDVCFQMLHYDAEGNKLGEFLAYPYVDPGIFN